MKTTQAPQGVAPLEEPSIRSADDVLKALEADAESGLTSPEAARRLAAEGRNELLAKPPLPTWRRILAHFQDPLIYLLLAVIAVALIAWGIEGWVGWRVNAIVIASVVIVNGVLGFVQEASLTGESEAVLKDAATLPGEAAVGDRLDMVFKGTAVAQGTGRAVVTATGMSTQMGAIAQMLEATAQDATPLQKEVSRIGRMLGIAVIVISIVVVGTILAIPDIKNARDVIEVLLLGVALAVAAVPEGLPANLAVVLALGVQRMAKHKAIVKNLSSVETLGSASVICTDKTGTLTRSEMTIERIILETAVDRL